MQELTDAHVRSQVKANGSELAVNALRLTEALDHVILFSDDGSGAAATLMTTDWQDMTPSGSSRRELGDGNWSADAADSRQAGQALRSDTPRGVCAGYSRLPSPPELPQNCAAAAPGISKVRLCGGMAFDSFAKGASILPYPRTLLSSSSKAKRDGASNSAVQSLAAKSVPTPDSRELPL